MSQQVNDGGPAFPRPLSVHPDGWVRDSQDGMSVRDYLASQVAARIPLDVVDRLTAAHVSEPTWDEVGERGELIVPPGIIAERIAQAAYKLADAMLAARNGAVAGVRG